MHTAPPKKKTKEGEKQTERKCIIFQILILCVKNRNYTKLN